MIEKQLINIEDNISTHTLCISLMVALMGKDIMVLNNGALFSLRYDWPPAIGTGGEWTNAEFCRDKAVWFGYDE